MNIYARKSRWKFLLFLFATGIVVITFWYTQNFLRKVTKQEKEKIEIWANAISRKAHLVNYTKTLFDNLQKQELKSLDLYAKATRKVVEVENSEDLGFYLEIISSNDNIPVIVTDKDYIVTASQNLDPFFASAVKMTPSLIDSFTSFPPLKVYYYENEFNYIFYQNSKLYVQLRNTLDVLVKSFLDEVTGNSLSAPVIITDSSFNDIIAFSGQIDSTMLGNKKELEEKLKLMEASNEPIIVDIPGYGKNYIFYEESSLITQLRYFPIMIMVVIAIFLVVAYVLFSISRKAEQNQVWAGLAKESAHQLGTPISSLIGWIEMLKLNPETFNEAMEMEKDVERLKQVSERFSKVGSKAESTVLDVNLLVGNVVKYMKSRSSNKINYHFEPTQDIQHKANSLLLSWVIENLIKNSLDAMGSVGEIKISTEKVKKSVIIDISDTGKGIAKGNFKRVFKPGFTTKTRGWGLGLSLAKRIIEDYHHGKIMVKNSVIGEGTTFRIILK